MFSYQKLEVYKIAKDVVKRTYRLTKAFPATEQYGLISQMNRAAISIPSNIAEGNGRTSKKEKVHFISVSFASLMELTCQAEIATELDYIDSKQYNEFLEQCKDLSVRLSNYKKYLNNS